MSTAKDTEEHRRIYFEARRREKEHFFSLPLHKRIIQRIEHLNKRLTLNILGKALRIKQRTGKISLNDVSSVLILRYDALGDMVVTSPLWRILKKRKPSLKIGIGASSRNLDLLRADKDVDHVYNFSLPDKKLKEEEFAKARSEEYDLVIVCLPNQKTRSAIVARKASAKGLTASFVSDHLEPHNKIFSLTAVLPPRSVPVPMILQLQFLLENIIDIDIKEEERRPSIFIDSHVLEKTKSTIDDLLKKSNCKQYIVINTESATQFREWGYENNYLLAKEISNERPDTFIILTSSPLQEQKLLDYLKQQPSHPQIQYFSTTNIQEMAALIRFSSLVISPDTSIIHLASAEAKPTIGFYIQHNPWLPFRVPAKVYIPKTGEPVSTISVDYVRKGALELLDNVTSGPNTIDIFWCEEPVRIEQIISD